MIRTGMRISAALGVVIALACGGGEKPQRQAPAGPMPDTFRVAFETTKGRFVVEAYRDWSPLGVKRFYELAAMGAFDDNAFYRVIPNFVAQFGTPANPKLTASLDSVTIPDEPLVKKNERGTVSFAHNGPGTRSHTIFINRRHAEHLDTTGFVPFGRVVEGMAVVDSLKWPYRERPDHHLIATLGKRYLEVNFPKADYVRRASIISR